MRRVISTGSDYATEIADSGAFVDGEENLRFEGCANMVDPGTSTLKSFVSRVAEIAGLKTL